MKTSVGEFQLTIFFTEGCSPGCFLRQGPTIHLLLTFTAAVVHSVSCHFSSCKSDYTVIMFNVIISLLNDNGLLPIPFFFFLQKYTKDYFSFTSNKFWETKNKKQFRLEVLHVSQSLKFLQIMMLFFLIWYSLELGFLPSTYTLFREQLSNCSHSF